MRTNICVKCGNINLVDGTLGTPAQLAVNVVKGNTTIPFVRLKTGRCLNCGFVEVYLDRDNP